MEAFVARPRALPLAWIVASMAAVAVAGFGASLAAASIQSPAQMSSDQMSSGQISSSGAPSRELVEAARCRTSSPNPVEGLARSDSSTTQVTVTVHSSTELRLDGSGRVTGARTNSGCAPRATDSLAVERDGAPALAPADAKLRIAAIGWAGDWRTPGEWHEVGTQ